MTLSVSGPPSLPPIITDSVLKSNNNNNNTKSEEHKNKNEEKDPKRCSTPVTVTFFGQNDGKLGICQVEDEKINLNPFLNDGVFNPFHAINPFNSNNPFCDNEIEDKDESTEVDGKDSEEEVSLACNSSACKLTVSPRG